MREALYACKCITVGNNKWDTSPGGGQTEGMFTGGWRKVTMETETAGGPLK